MAARIYSEELLADVKLYLDITWEDETTDRKIASLIGNGMAYLNAKIGYPGDYESPGYPRALLIDYVRYARDGALDVFENNYRSMILAAQNRRKAGAYGAQDAFSCDE